VDEGFDLHYKAPDKEKDQTNYPCNFRQSNLGFRRIETVDIEGLALLGRFGTRRFWHSFSFSPAKIEEVLLAVLRPVVEFSNYCPYRVGWVFVCVFQNCIHEPDMCAYRG
jgi:hypothetical protein